MRRGKLDLVKSNLLARCSSPTNKRRSLLRFTTAKLLHQQIKDLLIPSETNKEESLGFPSETNKPLSRGPSSQPVFKLLLLLVLIFVLSLRLVSGIDVGACQELSTSNAIYNLTASLDSDTGACLNITGDNVTINGRGYWIAYAKTGTGYAIHAEQNNRITIRDLNINQTSTSRITSPAITIIDSYDNNIDNVTLSIAGDNSPDAYNYGVDFQNVTNSTITKSDFNMLTTCDYCYAIYLQSSSNDNTIEHIAIDTSGDYNAYGIFLDSSHRNLIYNATIYTIDYRGVGVYLSNADNNTINRSWIRTTDSDIDASAVYFSNSDNNLINNCNLSRGGSSQRLINFRDTCYDNNITNTNFTYGQIYYNGNIYRGFIDKVYGYSNSDHLITATSGEVQNITVRNSHFNYSRSTSSCQVAIDLSEVCDGWQVHNVNITGTGDGACGLGLNGADDFNGSNLIINTTGGNADSAGIELTGTQTNNYIYDSEINTANDNSIYAYGSSGDTGDLNLVNVSFQGVPWRAYYLDHAINVYWYLDIHINDSQGNDINNANVTAIDADNSQEFTVLTNSSGDIVRQVVQEYTQDGPASRDYKTSHTINVSASSYHNQSASAVMDQNRQITITIINKSLPYVEVVSPVEGRIYPTTSVLVNITNSSNTDTVWYEWNNTNYTYSGPGVHDFKITGEHNITAYANNTNGTSSHTVFFNISTKPVNVSSCRYLDSPNIIYQLNQSFTSTHGYCLIIKADNVTLEGNNYEIEYASEEPGTAIFSENQDYITIKNLNLNTTDDWRASSPAIQIRNSQYHLIENNTFYIDGGSDPNAQNYVIYLETVSNSNITNNSISVQSLCWYCWGVTLYSNSDNNTIKDNYIYSNGNQDAYAIYLYQSDGNLMHNNEIRTSGADGYGHYLYTSDNNIINKTFFRSTGGTARAAYLDTGSDNNLIDNSNFSIVTAGIRAIYLWDTSVDNNITNTNITTQGRGIDITSNCDRTLIDNVFINASDRWKAIQTSGAENGTLINSEIHFYEYSQFDGAIKLMSGSDYWKISNVNITSTGSYGGGLYIDNSNNMNATYLRINTSGSTDADAIRVIGSSTNNNFHHATLNSENDDELFFYSSGTGTYNFYNVNFTSVSWDTNPTHTLNVYWYVDIKVLNMTGGGVSGANVTGHEADGTQVLTELTNSTGDITAKLLREFTQNDNGARVDKTPHIFNTSATNYFNDSSAYTIDQDKQVNITLIGTNVPSVDILSPEQGRTYPGTTIWVNLSYTDNTNNLWYNWNDTNYTYTVPVQHNFKEEGEHTLYAFANNTNGTTNDTVTFTINLKPVNVSSCQDLDSPDLIYQLNQSVTGTSGNCFTFKANNITFDGRGYWVRYSSSGAGRAFFTDGYNNLTIKNTNINQTLTTRIGSPAITLKNSQNQNITNCTLSIAGDDSPDAYNYGIEFENVDSSYISKGTNDMLTTCDYCHAIYMHTGSDNNEIRDMTISTSGNNYAYGILLNNADNTLIQNGSIRTYDYNGDGIRLTNSDNTIINSTFIRTATGDNDADGIVIEAGSQNTWINRCNISAPRAATRAIYLYGATCNCVDTNITNTNITSTSGYGIYSLSVTNPNHRLYMDNLYIDTTDSVYTSIYIAYDDNGTLKNSELLHYDTSGASGALQLRVGADNFKATNVNISTTGNYAVGIYFESSTTARFNGTNIRINTTGTIDAEAVRYYGVQNNHWFYDSVFQADNDDEIYFYSTGSGDLNLVNTTFASKVWGGSATHDLNVYWYMDVYVNDTNGDPIPLVNVTAWDNVAGQEFTVLTDGTGNIDRQIAQDYTEDNVGSTYYSNYTVNATKETYNTNTTQVNMTTNKEIYFTLTGTEMTAPTVNINISLNNTDTPDTTPSVDFNFTDSQSSKADYCTLYFNDTAYNTTNDVDNNSQTTLTADTPLSLGRYDVYINCTDLGGNTGKSGVINITIKVDYINLSLNLNPNPANTDQNVSIYGKVNRSNGDNITDNAVRIFINNSFYYYNNDTGLLENTTPWWNSSWGYRAKIEVESLVGDNINNTIVMINFSTTNLVSDGKINSDCSDIRFTDINGNELDHTLEPSTCNTSATATWVWLNLTANSNITIYLYYGNSNANIKTDYTNPDESLLLYMHFDNSSEYGESSTLAYDFSKNGNNGTLGNGNEFINTSRGKYGGAVQLDGNGDYVNVPVSSTSLPNSEVTIMAWVYPVQLTGDNYRTIVSTTGSTSGGYGLRSWGNSDTGRLEFWYRSAGSYHDNTMSDDALGLNTWAFVATTYNGTTLTYYINGSENGIFSNSDGIIPLDDVDIGSLDFSGNLDWWYGSIDEVRIYNSTLTANEILAIYNSTELHYIQNHSLPRTDSNGDYNYTYTAPSTAGNYTVTVNTTYLSMSAEETAILQVQAPVGGGVNCTSFKCLVIRAAGSAVAIFDALGAVDIAGTLTQSASGSPDSNDFIIRNSTEAPVVWINESTGDMYMIGALDENNGGSCNPPQGSFFIRGNNSECVCYVNSTGDMWLRGNLRENAFG